MRKIRLDQNSPEWEKWREKGLGASDACIIEGSVNWNDRRGLMASKLGLESFEYNARMMRGHRLEPTARRLYEQKFDRVMEPVCVIHDEHEWLRASLDGLSADDKIVLEIKCPSVNAHIKALDDHYPHYYKPQIQHQLFVTGCQELHYWSYSDDEEFLDNERGALVVVYPEPDYQLALFKKEERFYREYQELKYYLESHGYA